MRLDSFFYSKDWGIVDVQTIPPHQAKYYQYDDISISNQASVSLLNMRDI